MANLWSGRFDNAPNAEVFDFGKSLPVDKRLIDDDITGSRAWAQALGRAGVLTPADTEAIVSGLDAVRAAVHANPAMMDGADDEDVHAFVERELVARIVMPANDCIPGVPATNRSPSTSASTSVAASLCSSGLWCR